jgi:hypothetical protein
MFAPGSRLQAASHAEMAAQPDPAAVERGQQLAPAAKLSAVPTIQVVPDGVVYSTRYLAAGAIGQLLPQDARRERAIIQPLDSDVMLCQTKELAQTASQLAAASSATVDAEGSVTSPGAFTTIAIIPATSLPAGEYTINVVVSLAGTVTQGTDNNNFKLVAGALSAVLDNTIGGNDQPFGPFVWTCTGANSILVQNIAAGTVGAIYSVTIEATPVQAGSPVIPNPVGMYLPARQQLEVKHRGLTWVANASNNIPTRISVMVERNENPDPFGHG